MKQRKIVIGLLVMLALAVSGFTFAFWSSGLTGNFDVASGTIAIGEGDSVTTTVVVENESNSVPMVPTAYAIGSEDTVVLTFDIDWTGTGATGALGNLVISVNSYTLGTLSEAEIDAMFTITPETGVVVTNGTTQQATVTVVFTTEPASQAIYNQVANGTLEINLTFTVSPQ